MENFMLSGARSFYDTWLLLCFEINYGLELSNTLLYFKEPCTL